MYELIAIGPGGRQRWRRPLPAEALVRLGRSPLDGWAVPWDMRISREHADLLLAGERLHIRCLASAHNDIHCGPQRLRDAAIGPRETFRIGSTIFCLVPAGEPIAPSLGQGRVECPQPSGLRPDPPEGWPAADADQRLVAYTPVETVHRGQWADVYMARHSSLGRWTAVQMQIAGGDPEDESAVRLRQKCQLLASFRHPHLPICHDAGAIDGRVFLAMEWIEGQDLVAAGGGLLGIPPALDLVCQTSRALAYAHRCGVVHREVTPAHLLVDRDGQVVLIGWSRALRLGDSSMATYERRDRLIANPEYSAPEQIADCRRVDRRADIYSLGCTLYWLLTGRVPFPGQGSPAAQRLQRQPRLGELRRDAPEPLERVLLKMIANVPEERFARMEDVLAALQPLCTSTLP